MGSNPRDYADSAASILHWRLMEGLLSIEIYPTFGNALLEFVECTVDVGSFQLANYH